MINKIANDEQLQAEKERMHQLLEEKKQQINSDFNEIKEELEPVKKVTHVVQNMFSNSNHDNLIRLGVNIGVDVLLNKFLLRRAGWAAKLIVPYIVKNVTLNYLTNHKINAIEKALHIVKHITRKDDNRAKSSNYPSLQGQDLENSLKTIY